jgi:ABC-2 type transport system permease protein
MRKMLVIAAREYKAAMGTRTFLISLVMIPALMGTSILVQRGMRASNADRRFVLVNHSAARDLIARLEAATETYNQSDPVQERTRPRFVIVRVEDAAGSAPALAQQRLRLSDEVRGGALTGFLEIIPAEHRPAEAPADTDLLPGGPGSQARVYLRYETNRPTSAEFALFIKEAAAGVVRARLMEQDQLSAAQLKALLQPVVVESRGLSRRDARTALIEESPEQSRFSLVVPVVLALMMMLMVLMTATPFMQSVVEEKMARITEVLLGSVHPVELMMGKLLGMVAVSLTTAAAYLGAAYWAVNRYGWADEFSAEVLVWYVVFQVLATLMYGSLFLAVGAACTDMTETQHLLWVVFPLIVLPLSLMSRVVQDSSGVLARGLSFFPFATPAFMVLRVALPPGVAGWELALGVLETLLTTVLCVYAAGRIFRVGILVQGKGARFGQILEWVLRG